PLVGRRRAATPPQPWRGRHALREIVGGDSAIVDDGARAVERVAVAIRHEDDFGGPLLHGGEPRRILLDRRSARRRERGQDRRGNERNRESSGRRHEQETALYEQSVGR